MGKSSLKESAIRTIELEQAALAGLVERIDENFIKTCELITHCLEQEKGRVVLMGMGKSGHIANKIASTLASTGTPSYFVHPAEAGHGDIGMVTDHDVVIAVSNSGKTPEIESLLPILKRKGVTLIAMTGNRDSLLAREADAILDVSVEKEACPHNLAPTSSTTAALVMGDALAITLLDARGFTAEDFTSSHPGGSLGNRSFLMVSDIMHSGNDIPRVDEETSVSDSVIEMSARKLGMTTVTGPGGEVCGVFTDGDLRRFLEGGGDIRKTPINKVMTENFKSIEANELASAAAKIMQDNEIYTLVVIDEDKSIQGIVTMHDLLKANVV